MSSTNTRAELERKLRSTTSPWDRLPILLGLARETVPGDLEYGYRRGMEALNLAKDLNDRHWIAHSMHAIGRRLMKHARYSEVLHYLERAARLFRQLNDPISKAQADYEIAVTYVFMGRFDEAMKLLMEDLPIYEVMADRFWLVRAYRYLGYIFGKIGEHARGLEHYQQALAIATDANLEEELAFLYEQLGLTYRDIGENRQHRRYLFKSLTIHRKLGNRTGIATVTGNIASMYLEQNLHARAEKYVRQSRQMCHALGFRANEAMAWGQLGAIYSNDGDFARASRYYRKGIALAQESESKLVLGHLYEHFGVVCLKDGRPEPALQHLKQALQILSESGYTLYLYDVHLNLSAVYQALGNMTMALRHHEEYSRMKDEHINTEKAFEAGRVEMQAQFRRLAESLKQERLKTQSLTKTLEQKEAELVTLTLQLIQKDAGRKENGTPGKLSPSKRGEENSDNWGTFARQFHKVHQDFYTGLIKRYPELTPAEMKVCSLIRVGLSTKEMASLLGISKRTVDTHRTRVHKKIGLPAGSSLAGFIVRM